MSRQAGVLIKHLRCPSMENTHSLVGLYAGQLVPFGGDRVVEVSEQLAEAFEPGDHLVVVQTSGALLHIPSAEKSLVQDAVSRASAAFAALTAASDDQISDFYEAFATYLGDGNAFAHIVAANAHDVTSAAQRARSTTRLELTERMRADMIAGLRVWRDTAGSRHQVIDEVHHQGWSVSVQRAPLGVVGFVFEGRPNVFADATGVLRTGNTAVLRIGSDALRTARAIMQHALAPALRETGLPDDAVVLVESPSRATGWALFNDRRLSLAIARGSGEAVAQLGAVARQAGVAVSLHGTGGAWLMASTSADRAHFRQSVLHSLDRKVCNTLNVCCIVVDRAAELVPVFLEALDAAAAARGSAARLHIAGTSTAEFVGSYDYEELAEVSELCTEWEWDNAPEVSLVVVDTLDEAIGLFDRYSPHLAASLISNDADEQRQFYDRCDAPFIGNGFTRWVDGQFALNRPELGLSNWEAGRLFGRSAVLSGDSVFTVRLRATVTDSELHR